MTDPRLARPLWRGRTNVDALTIACLERAEKIGGHTFTVTQGSYQAGAGDVNSAGTHDGGGVVDLRWCGHVRCILALRRAGMAAWHRTPAQGPWPDHVHAVVVGHPLLAAAAAGQVVSYLARRNGLANNGPDDGPQLDPIPRPVWPWPPTPEDDMFEKQDSDRLERVEQLLVATRIEQRKRDHRIAERLAEKLGASRDRVLAEIDQLDREPGRE